MRGARGVVVDAVPVTNGYNSAMPTVQQIDRSHPEVDLRNLRRFRALYEGGDAFDDLKRDFLPQMEKEAHSSYDDRMRRCCYVNLVGPLIDLIASWLLETPPTADAIPPRLSHILDDADGCGSSLESVVREAIADALVERTIFVWADLPPAREYENYLQQEAAGAFRPTLRFLRQSAVKNWATDAKGNLTWIVAHEDSFEQPDPLSPILRVRRWYVIDRIRIRVYRWTAEEGSPEYLSGPRANDPVETEKDVEHGHGFVPVVRFELKAALWAMKKLKDPAKRAFMAENDVDWALHKAAHAILLYEQPDMSKHYDEGGAISVGPGSSQEIPNSASMKWLEPSGTSFAALRQQRLDTERAVYRVLHQMAVSLPESTRQVSSAGAKNQDWEAMRIVMSAYSLAFTEMVTKALDLAARVARVDGWKAQVQGMNGWRHKTLEDFLQAVVMTLGAQTMSPTFARTVAKVSARKLLDEYVSEDVLRDIEDEIDAAAPFGANLAQAGKALGDDVFSATGARDLVDDAEGGDADEDEEDEDGT